MLRLIVLAAALVCVLGAPRVVQRPRFPKGGRIVGGSEVAIEEVPWQLSVEERGSHICGASIISAQWAVTAAHCVEGGRPNDFHLRAGSAILGQGGNNHNAEEIIVNEQYDVFTIDFDVAVIRVNQPFEFDSTIAAIPLAMTAPAAGTPATVSGWGTTESGGTTLPDNLLWVDVPIYDQEACNMAYVDFGGVTDQMICAGLEEGGQDSCQGDSGGPLFSNGELVGIVSWGKGCAEPGFPGVYSNVATLRQWILNNSA